MINRVSESYKHHIVSITLGPLLKLIEAFFDLLIPLFMKAVIDLNQYLTPESIPNQLSRGLAAFIRMFPQIVDPLSLSDALIGGIIIFVMGVLGFIITMLAQYIAAKTSVSVGVEIRNSLFKKVLNLSKKQKDKVGSGKILTAINSDTYQIQQGVLIFVRLIARAPLIIIGSLVISYILDWRIGIAFTGIVPLILLVIFLVLYRSEKSYVTIQGKLDNISTKNTDTVEGARVIRAFKKEDEENSKFKKESTSYQLSAIKVNKINALINPLTFAITAIVLIVILFILSPSLIEGNLDIKTSISSTMIAEMAYLYQIFFTTVQLTGVLLDLIKARVSRKRVDEIFNIKDDIVDGELTNNDDYQTLIKLENVYFSYKDDSDSYALKNISFELNKGETLGIIGGTGSGKTSVINLLERFYDANKGNVFFKEKDIKSYKISSLRKSYGLVNQKSSLFKGTVRSNLLMAKPNANEEEMITALKKAEAYSFVMEKDGLDTLIEENGSNLSGGQKQRLCIARALLQNPEILILDDSTSALDLLTDKHIRTSINEMKEMSKIIISQRVSTVKESDLILVMDKGEIVGKGTHGTLLKDCSIYNEIYETQIRSAHE